MRPMSAAPGRVSRGAAPAARARSPARSRAVAAKPAGAVWTPAPGRDPRCLGASLEGFLAAAVARPATIATDGWSGYGGLAAAGYTHEPLEPQRQLGRCGAAPARDPSGVRADQALAARHPPRRRLEEASPGLSRRVRAPLDPPHRQKPAKACPRDPASCPPRPASFISS